jgi:hypothetical protein
MTYRQRSTYFWQSRRVWLNAEPVIVAVYERVPPLVPDAWAIRRRFVLRSFLQEMR